jgi:geranylgeranyl pyrophosphate synthase
MQLRKQAELLREEIETVLSALPDMGGLRCLVREPLIEMRRGLALGTASDRPWPLLPLVVCEAISGQFESSLPVATALQFLIAACDVFDDVEDADSPDSLSSRYGAAVATNVATALLFLGEKAIMRLEKWDIDAELIVRITDAANSFYIIACAGQHMDLSQTSGKLITEVTCPPETIPDIIS